MFTRNFIRFFNQRRKIVRYPVLASKRNDDFSKTDPNLGDMGSKYKTFRDEDSEMILDIFEEQFETPTGNAQRTNQYEGLNLERGVNGVYEIEDLVTVLKRENGLDLFVASVPKEVKYVDYICVVSGQSQRHMQAMAQFVRKVYKKKKTTSDSVPRLEGLGSKDWMALDLGNIALHIFSREARKLYDLDSLWAIGPKYDEESNKEDPVAEMLEKHSIYLQDLQPAS